MLKLYGEFSGKWIKEIAPSPVFDNFQNRCQIIYEHNNIVGYKKDFKNKHAEYSTYKALYILLSSDAEKMNSIMIIMVTEHAELGRTYAEVSTNNFYWMSQKICGAKHLSLNNFLTPHRP
jgi:hypothetical protein